VSIATISSWRSECLGVRATRVDPAERIVHLETGRRVRYDKLLIATGVRNRRPPIPGLELQGVFALRSVTDADALRGRIAPGARAVVIGMGFIGCEVAASLRQKGVAVVAIEPSPTPLFRVLGDEVGTVVAAIHRDHGVETIFDDLVMRFEGHGRVERVITKQGRHRLLPESGSNRCCRGAQSRQGSAPCHAADSV
jgi:3-phenylpropionate/trans-cinnamate dioxygenase ferredoxin reductase subunit